MQLLSLCKIIVGYHRLMSQKKKKKKIAVRKERTAYAKVLRREQA